MKPTALSTQTLDDRQRALRAEGRPYALATVVRASGSSSALPGAKAIVSAAGEILEGWMGGGCARGAIGRAARIAISRNDPVFVALRPDEELEAEGVEPCEVRDGMIFERNGCASKGSLDIFVEPFVPSPDLVILGEGPVAIALAALAGPFDFRLKEQPPREPVRQGRDAPYVVVATQGRGDLAALEAALKVGPAYLAFVGSGRKAAALKQKLLEKGHNAEALDQVVAPAGLPIGAATPDEIALSILAQIIAERRGAK